MAEQADPESPLTCARCGATLHPGSGNFYRVTIEAVADPTPPTFTAEDLAADVRQQIERLLARLESVSEQEALDQVYRRRMLYLCGPCFRRWIEDPTG
jgi:hypothetical protein